MTVGLFIGFLLGLGVGVLLARALDWWLTVQEWRRASEHLRLTDEVLQKMVEDQPRPDRARR